MNCTDTDPLRTCCSWVQLGGSGFSVFWLHPMVAFVGSVNGAPPHRWVGMLLTMR